MAADLANRPVPVPTSSDLPPPTLVIAPADDDLPSYLPPRVASFSKPPPLSHTPEKGSAEAAASNSNAVTGADEDPSVRNIVIAQTAIRGYLARKQYKELYELNRWRLEAPMSHNPRLISPLKDKAKRKSRPMSRGFHVDSLPQHNPDRPPSDVPDDTGAPEEGEESKPKAPRKSYAPGMLLAPGMGFGADFDPAMVKLKSAPRPVSMDMKLAAQSPPLKPVANLKPVPVLATNTAATKSMPDMPAMPKLKSAGKSPLAEDGAPAVQVQPPTDPPPHNVALAVPGDASPKRSPAVPKKPGPKMVLPPEWEQHVDIQGRKYYFNKETQETTWKPPPMVPEHTIVRKVKQQPATHHSQTNLFGNLEMLIPEHKFAPQVPKKPPPPPTVGTPPPPEHSPLPSTPLSPDTPPLIVAPPLALGGPSSPPPNTTTTTTTAQNPPQQPPPSSSSSTKPVIQQQPPQSQQPLTTSTSNPTVPVSAPHPAAIQPSSSTSSLASQPATLERTPSQQGRDKRSALRRLLDAFLRRRPTKDDLVHKGVLHEEDEKKDAKERKKLEKERKKKEKEDKKKAKK